MAFCYDNLKLDKGMYQEAGSTFTQVLERQDPSDQYKGTSLEGLDAFQRQLKRFDIRVKGAGSDVVEKFFRTRRFRPSSFQSTSPGRSGRVWRRATFSPTHRRCDRFLGHGLPLPHCRGGRGQ